MCRVGGSDEDSGGDTHMYPMEYHVGEGAENQKWYVGNTSGRRGFVVDYDADSR